MLEGSIVGKLVRIHLDVMVSGLLRGSGSSGVLDWLCLVSDLRVDITNGVLHWVRVVIRVVRC